MKQLVTIISLAVISICSLGYIVMTTINSENIKPIEAQAKAEKFINDNLLPTGQGITISEITEENGLYKMPISLSDGTNITTYMSKDGQLFFPEGLNIDQITQEINENKAQNQMELQKEILIEGTGDQLVKSGDSITVDYTGTLEDGTKFDSSLDTGQPFTFTIGQGQVIQGWEQGLIGMKVGEEIRLTIPSNLAYGPNGTGPIPPNATLIFTIKLISIN